MTSSSTIMTPSVMSSEQTMADRAQSFAHQGAAVLAQGVKGPLLKNPQRNVEHKGYGKPGNHRRKYAEEPAYKVEERAEVQHDREQYYGENYNKQDGPHVFAAEVQGQASLPFSSLP